MILTIFSPPMDTFLLALTLIVVGIHAYLGSKNDLAQ